MTWRDRAAAAIAERGRGEEPTKPTELGSVGFVGGHTPLLSRNSAAVVIEQAGSGRLAQPAGSGQERMALALAFLEKNPEIQRACFADTKADPANIVLTVAIRAPWGAVEVLVERDRFDSMAMLELAQRYPLTALHIPEH